MFNGIIMCSKCRNVWLSKKKWFSTKCWKPKWAVLLTGLSSWSFTAMFTLYIAFPPVTWSYSSCEVLMTFYTWWTLCISPQVSKPTKYGWLRRLLPLTSTNRATREVPRFNESAWLTSTAKRWDRFDSEKVSFETFGSLEATMRAFLVPWMYNTLLWDSNVSGYEHRHDGMTDKPTFNTPSTLTLHVTRPSIDVKD